MKPLNADIKSQVHDWNPIIGKGSEDKSFAQNFGTTLHRKMVLNQKEIELFKKLVKDKKEGVWMHSLTKLFSEINHIDLFPQLVKYGVSDANIEKIVFSLTPLVFHVFPPSDSSYDCLVTASNLEQPLWIFKSNRLREHALLHYCKDLMEHLKLLSCQYFNTWTSIESIGDYRTDKFEFTRELILMLLYHYKIVDVEIFCDLHCFLFKTKVEDSWNQIFEHANDKNIVDSFYEFDLIRSESKIILTRVYFSNRSDLSRFIPFPGKNSHEVVITGVVSPVTLSAFPSDQMLAIHDNQARMNFFYSSDLPMLRMKEEDIQTFTQCVVKYQDSYYRAMIARVLSETDVRLELTDFNWMMTFPKSSLLYLHSMFTKLKLQSMTLRLAHISDVIASKEIIIQWLKFKFFEEFRMCGIFVEPCSLDGTRRVASVLVKVRRKNNEWVYLHQLMAEKGFVIVNEKNCLFHEKGVPP